MSQETDASEHSLPMRPSHLIHKHLHYFLLRRLHYVVNYPALVRLRKHILTRYYLLHYLRYKLHFHRLFHIYSGLLEYFLLLSANTLHFLRKFFFQGFFSLAFFYLGAIFAPTMALPGHKRRCPLVAPHTGYFEEGPIILIMNHIQVAQVLRDQCLHTLLNLDAVDANAQFAARQTVETVACTARAQLLLLLPVTFAYL